MLPPPLTPRIDADLRSVLTSDLLPQLVSALGSPLNVLLPDRIAANVDAFRAVYREHRLDGQIFYAHKANRSAALVRRLAATGAGIDVASLGELRHALGAGFTGDRIMATGPKTREFLWLAARTGAIVNADSVTELADLAAVVAAHSLPRVRVMARLSGFAAPGTRMLTRRSRFGTPADGVPEMLDVVAKHHDQLDLIGVSYHLDTIGLPEKAAALEGCLRALDECHRRGLRPRAIDVGGGFGVDYLAEGADWDRWTTELTGAVLGRRPPMTWNGHGYGLRNENGTLRGALGAYPAHRPVAGPSYLDKLLSAAAPSLRRPLATLLLDNMYDLHTEPGRALLDQCGLVLARVEEVRGDLVRLGLNAGDVSLEEHGVLMDPILLGALAETDPVGVHLIGNLCLEADLITRRQVRLPRLPRPGDLLAFVNTAGYFMDFAADHALMQPVARTVALYREDASWRWCSDDEYWPVSRGSVR